MPRSALILVLLGVVACAPAGPPGAGPSRLTPVSIAGAARADEPLTFALEVEVAGAPAEAEAKILVGFPHWYYGMRGVRPVAAVSARVAGAEVPSTVRALGWGRWYAEATLPKDVPVGGRIVIEVRDAPPVGVMGPLRPLLLRQPLRTDL